MIKIKDKTFGETWKILEKGDSHAGTAIKNDSCFIVPIMGYESKVFSTVDEAIYWVGKQIRLRRETC